MSKLKKQRTNYGFLRERSDTDIIYYYTELPGEIIGYDEEGCPIKGKRKQKTRSTGCKNFKDARKWVRKNEEKIQSESSHNKFNSNKYLFFANSLRAFLDYKSTKVKRTTFDEYERIAEKYIIDYFGEKVKLEELNVIAFDNYFTFIQTKGARRSKGGLSVKTTKRHYSLLNDFYNYLKKRKIVEVNPVAGRDFKREKKYEYKIYSEEEIKKLKHILHDEKIRIAVYLGLLGLRRGEVSGLKWKDVDFKNRKLKIRRSRVRSKGKTHEDSVKTASSNREIAIPKSFILELKREKERHKKLKRIVPDFNDNNWICIYNNGKPLRLDYITKRWKKVIEKSSLKHIRFHDLRHSYASYAIANNIPMKVVAENLGHASIDITVNTYAHVLDEDKYRSAEVVEDMI